MSTRSFDLDSAFWELDDEDQLAVLGYQRDEGPHRKGRRETKQAMSNLVEDTALDESFVTTYKPSRYEQAWLAKSLGPFVEDHLVTDVEAMIKGGKEASVYRCAANPSLGVAHLAAKVYRPQQFRNLRQDDQYREGRDMLVPSGSEIKPTDGRVIRAVRNKTTFGREVRHLSWMTHEYRAMERLHALGGDVPKPIAVADNAILMGYLGGPDRAAPTLHEVDLDPRKARALRDRALHNVELLLGIDLIHGDLSAFNILYWEGRLVLIDFPQVVNAIGNPQARGLLGRDLQRLDDYFARLGAGFDVDEALADLWERYVGARAGFLPLEAMEEEEHL